MTRRAQAALGVRIMPDSGIFVRRATPEDVAKATETLGAAFADYVWTRHTVAADNHEERVRQLQGLFLSRIGLPYGEVWVTDGCEAVAIWTTPATLRHVEKLFAELAPKFAELAGSRSSAWLEAEEALAPHRPRRPVWFLSSVGVHPDWQGQGLASAVLRPGIKAAEKAGVPAYLETSTARNVAIYQHLGFEVQAEVELPGGGPRTWCMVRR